MKLNNKVYDVLKWVVIIVLPAIAVFYTDIATIWGLPYADKIPDTIMSINLLLGVVLGISSANYKNSRK